MARVCPEPSLIQDLAVAVSGGGDSLALAYLLQRWAMDYPDLTLHMLTVDHQLRPEAAAEAAYVAQVVAAWPHVIHQTLLWRGRKPRTAVAERARAARYDLLQDYCTTHDIQYLVLAHQQDDQAETFLMRLAAGSGLDGLAAMLPVQNTGAITLLRPLLSVPHERLLVTLRAARLKWVEDPTNQNTDYLRPRLRAARDVLAAEGLTPSRLAVTSGRVARGRAALEAWADQLWHSYAQHTSVGVGFDRDAYFILPDDMQIRLLTRALTAVNGKSPPARMEQIEQIWAAIQVGGRQTVRVTLGGCVVTRGAKTLKISKEKA